MGENATVEGVCDGWSGQEAETYSMKRIRKSEGRLLGGYDRVYQDQDRENRLERERNSVTSGPCLLFTSSSISLHS